MTYTTTATSCTTLAIYHPPETFIESIRGQKSEEQLRKDLLVQLMDSVFRQVLKLEKTFHHMIDSTISITWVVPNPYLSTSQQNLANEQNRHEATNQPLRNLIWPKSTLKISTRNHIRSALQLFPDKRSQYEIRKHRTIDMNDLKRNLIIFLSPRIINENDI